jgi:chromate reductase, NAD(P)H dehydrogenase (quinone)
LREDIVTEPIHVIGISGSLRRASWNSGLLREAAKLAPEGMTITIADISQIPLYNQDNETPSPDVVTALREQIRNADAVLFAVPEYNYSIPGVLKNAIDYLSRPNATQPFNGKPAALFGAGGRVGTARAQLHMRQIGTTLNLYFVNKPEVLVIQGTNEFDAEGNLIDPKSMFRPQITTLLQNLADLTAKLRGR